VTATATNGVPVDTPRRRYAGGAWLLAAVALLGQLAFTLAWFVGGLFEPDYDPLRQTISELASLDGHRPLVMTAGFAAFGISVLALALALRRTVRRDKRLRVGPGMLVLAALPMPVVAGARMDCARSSQACRDAIEADVVSGQHHLHDLASLVVFVMLVLAPLVFARAFGRDGHWRDLRRWSLLTGGLGFVLLATFVTVGDGTAMGGLLQRVLVGLLTAWIAVTATRALRTAGTRVLPSRPSPHIGRTSTGAQTVR
jgi:hypothetical membrane protein